MNSVANPQLPGTAEFAAKTSSVAAGPSVPNPSAQLSEPQLQRLGEILDTFLVQAERGERPSIDAVCAEQPDLADAIRHYVQSINMLEDAAAQLRSPPLELRSPIQMEHRQLGDYRLIREIGRGGMGVVYEAQQISLARRVALKILPFAAVLDARKIARFQNEAQAAASLHHPHIVPVFAVGNDRGTYFYSMQYIDGQSLDFAIAQLQDGQPDSLSALYGHKSEAVLRNATTIVAGEPLAPLRLLPSAYSAELPSKQRSSKQTVDQTSPAAVSTIRIPLEARSTDERSRINPSSATLIQTRDYVRRVVELGVQAADALHHAHQCGIVHRDIKPSNLLVDTSGNLWITDFGLAQCSSLDSLTASGDIMGTLRYMSPEQAAGKSHWIDNRTDIYSLGQTLYELLTLHQAVDGTNRAAIMRQIETLEPTPPRRINSCVPVDLENIILKCLTKQREDRYHTADALAADLRRFLAGQTPMARKPTMLDRSARWVARHSRAVAVACCLIAICLIAALSVASVLTAKNRQIVQSHALAEKHLQIANEAVYRFGNGTLDRLELLPGSDALRLDIARRSVAYFKQFTDYATGQSHMQRDVARALMACADIEAQTGDLKSAIANYSAAAEILLRERAAQPHQLQLFNDWLLCANSHACVLARVGQRDQAMQMIGDALAMVEQSPQSTVEQAGDALDRSALTAWLHLNLGTFASDRGQSKLAQEQLAKASTLLKSVDANASAAWRRSELSMLITSAWLQAGQTVTTSSDANLSATDDLVSQQLLDQALKLAEARLVASKTGDANVAPIDVSGSSSSSATANSLEQLAAQHDVALCELALGAQAARRSEWSRARTCFMHSISLLNQLCQFQPGTMILAHDLASAINNLGQVELKLKQTAAAEAAFRESQRQLERLHLITDDYRVASSLAGVLHNRAALEDGRGEHAAAIELLNQAIVLQEQAIARAPDDIRCQDFLSQHRAHLSRLTSP